MLWSQSFTQVSQIPKQDTKRHLNHCKKSIRRFSFGTSASALAFAAFAFSWQFEAVHST